MKSRVIYAVIALFLMISEARSQSLKIDLWGDGEPPIKSVVSGAESVDDNGFVRSVERAELFVYKADRERNCGRAVVLFPGGGYGGVSMKSEGSEFAKWLSDNGVTAAVLKYRLPSGNDRVPVGDAERAMQIMKDSASVWGYCAGEIGVMGFSAGGHLASTIAVRCNPSFAVLFYPVISADENVWHRGSFESLTGGDRELMKYYSSELHVSKNTPPTLLLHSSDDTVVPIKNSELFRDALIKNGVLVEFVVYPSGGHGWGFKSGFEYHEQMKGVVLAFILNNN